MQSYKLTYFDVRGRGELARLCFATAGVEFEDERITNDQWTAVKPLAPFGQLPMLEINGTKYTQSFAITRYIAREFGLYGKDNLDQLKVDEVVGLSEDFRQCFVQIYHEHLKTNVKKEKELQEKFDKEDLPKFLRYFEDIISKNNSDFFVGDQLTLADLAIYDVLEYPLDHSGDILLKEYPRLANHRSRLESIENLNIYLTNRKKSEI